MFEMFPLLVLALSLGLGRCCCCSCCSSSGSLLMIEIDCLVEVTRVFVFRVLPSIYSGLTQVFSTPVSKLYGSCSPLCCSSCSFCPSCFLVLLHVDFVAVFLSLLLFCFFLLFADLFLVLFCQNLSLLVLVLDFDLHLVAVAVPVAASGCCCCSSSLFPLPSSPFPLPPSPCGRKSPKG